MPYIFLNTVADITNFNIPTPIIVSGDYLTGQNSIKTKCDKIISHDIGCSAYLLSVSLVELLDVLEREGFKTVKVNRSRNHNVWILHKDRNSDRLVQIKNIKNHTIQISKENLMIEENSSHSSFGKFDEYNLSQYYKPCMKSEKSQTPARLSLIGGGDFTDVFSVYSQCDDEQSRFINEVVIAHDHKNITHEKPVKLQKDFQTQMNLNDIVNSVDIGCQFNTSNTVLKTDKYYDLNKIDKTIHDNIDKKQNSNFTISDRNYPETAVSKDNCEIIVERNGDIFLNVKSETTLTTVNNKIGSNTITDKADSFLKIGLNGLLGTSKENISDETHEVLVKLKKRFKTEHEYFSNVRIKKSKKKEKCLKKPIDNSKKSNSNNGTLIDNFEDVVEECERNTNDINNDINDNLSFKDTINYSNKIDILDKISNLTLVQPSESLHFYDALDTSSVISTQDSFKSIINEDNRLNGIKRIAAKVKTNNIDSNKLFRNTVSIFDINRLNKVKSVDSSKRFHVTYNYSNKESLKKATCTDKISCNKHFVEKVDKLEKIGHLKNSLESVALDDLKTINCSKMYLHLDNSSKSGKIIKKANPAVDYLTLENKRDIFKEKMQMNSSRQQCDFKSRLHQRAESLPINKKQQFASSARQISGLGRFKEPFRNSKDIRELKAPNIFNGSLIHNFDNKERVASVSKVQLNRNLRFGNLRLGNYKMKSYVYGSNQI